MIFPLYIIFFGNKLYSLHEQIEVQLNSLNQRKANLLNLKLTQWLKTKIIGHYIFVHSNFQHIKSDL